MNKQMDILSMKNKSGRVSGSIFVNGAPLKANFKRAIGFVDQVHASHTTERNQPWPGRTEGLG